MNRITRGCRDVSRTGGAVYPWYLNTFLTLGHRTGLASNIYALFSRYTGALWNIDLSAYIVSFNNWNTDTLLLWGGAALLRGKGLTSTLGNILTMLLWNILTLLGGNLMAFLPWNILTMVALTRFVINCGAFIFEHFMALTYMDWFTDL